MKTSSLIKKIEGGELDPRLLEVYCDHSMIEKQRERYISVLNQHRQLYGEADVCIISVPGRSEITGNHTDHQHGCVLACSVNLDIIAVVSKSEKMSICSNGRYIRDLDIDALAYDPKQSGTSTALVKGVLAKLVENEYKIGNVDAAMVSNVPVGSGLSSSAAFEVMIGNIMSVMFNEGRIPQVEIAKYSQYAENIYFGKPSGLMDQCACAFGGVVHIDFRDAAEPVVKQVHINLEDYGYSLCIVKTGGSHAGLTDDYSSITGEMKKVARHFRKEVLRDVSEEDILAELNVLREKCGDRAVLRALHMQQENKRVDLQLENLSSRDFDGFLKVIRESGDSSYKYLQNVYTNKDISSQPISVALLLSEMYLKENGVARVHGGGFAGTIQAFVKNDHVAGYKNYIEKFFGRDSCVVLQINNLGACKVI